MQTVVSVLGLACLAALFVVLVLSMTCSGCGCMPYASVLPFLALPFMGVGLMGAAIWSEQRQYGIELTTLFRAVVVAVNIISGIAVAMFLGALAG